MFKIFAKKPASTNDPATWDLEKRTDRDVGFGGYNFPDSVVVAMDFFFRARLSKLTEEQQKLIHILPEWMSAQCQRIVPTPIDDSGHCRSRIIYIGSRDGYDVEFRVVVLRGQGKDEWRVVGFHYPRDNKGHYYAVFEPHHAWSRWWAESGYLSLFSNPDY